ncbi:MAG: glycoside hydrolase family 3 protein [Clostridia bacterium]|nr:glycoside hydrolase family 3 protein [Clostridia bacterium]
MVNLKDKPFYLNDEQIKWVEDTINSMSLDEKIGQLFINLGANREEDYLKNVVAKYHIGGARYNPGLGKDILQQNKILQKNSKIPLLIACNTEGGGDGACADGTAIGMPVKIGATNDSKYAYELGKVCGVEAQAVGCNWMFSPVVDINMNFRNPIVSKRCFNKDADKVAEYSVQFLKGVKENSNVICAMKHYPGDGLDERDQHLSRSVNSLSCEDWDKTFGKVYSAMIEEGVQSVMVGHIMLPSYSKALNPSLKDEEIMPATLSKEILQGLLRDKLGFNGLIVTDASHMVGLTCEMKRCDMLPTAIAAGCDMFLFFNDMDEDFEFMKKGYENGVITEERLNDALLRILGTKASMGLTEPFDVDESLLWKVGCAEHKAMEAEVAEKSITLVKNKEEIFPITPSKHKRILIVPAKALSGPNLFSVLSGPPKKTPAEKMKDLLEAEGFEVEIYESPFERMAKLPPEQRRGEINIYLAGKTSVESFTSKYDLVITLTNVTSYGQTTERISWSMAKGGGEIPWYVHELPVIVVSLSCPFILLDVPQARNYINTYADTDATLKALTNKLLGKTAFEGVDPVDAFCGKWDTRL